MKSFFKAGCGRIDITPPPGTLMNGDFIIHYAQHIHDNLYAKALVVQNENATVVMVVVDICAMTKDFIDSIKLLINKDTQIPVSNILVSATHTHYGGAVADLLMGAADLPYTMKLPSLIVAAAKKAFENLRPAKIAYGAVDSPEHVVCRRYFMQSSFTDIINPVTGKPDKIKTNPFGAEHLIDKRVSVVDTGLSFAAIQGDDGKWISVLANYSMHYVGDCKNGTITADYFGQFADQLADKLSAGDEFVAILSNGTSGEASIWDFIDRDRYPTADFAKSRLIGGDLAEQVIQSLRNPVWETDPSVSVLYEEITVNTRKPSPSETTAAKKIVAETSFEGFQPYNGMKPMDDSLRIIYAREQVLLNEYPDRISFPVQAIRIGSGIIGGLGGEFFAETGLWLKKNKTTPHYFTICLANGFVGYVPPAHEIELGGYETWRCRTSFLAVNAEEQIRKKLYGMINQLS